MYQLQDAPAGKTLAEVGSFRNVNRVSTVVPGDGKLIRANNSTAPNLTGSDRAMYRTEAKIVG
jgi:hypothetical protein